MSRKAATPQAVPEMPPTMLRGLIAGLGDLNQGVFTLGHMAHLFFERAVQDEEAPVSEYFTALGTVACALQEDVEIMIENLTRFLDPPTSEEEGGGSVQ